MSRVLLIALMCLLPLQWSAAAVGSYCLHEKAPQAQKHFGHHDHTHQAASVPSVDADAASFDDPDCPSCHFHFTGATGAGAHIDSAPPAFLPLPALVSRAPRGLPDNPFRPPLAAGR